MKRLLFHLVTMTPGDYEHFFVKSFWEILWFAPTAERKNEVHSEISLNTSEVSWKSITQFPALVTDALYLPAIV